VSWPVVSAAGTAFSGNIRPAPAWVSAWRIAGALTFMPDHSRVMRRSISGVVEARRSRNTHAAKIGANPAPGALTAASSASSASGRSRRAATQAATGASGRSGSAASRSAAASTCPGCESGVSLLTTTRLTTKLCCRATSARYPSMCDFPVPKPPAIPMPGPASAHAAASAASNACSMAACSVPIWRIAARFGTPARSASTAMRASSVTARARRAAPPDSAGRPAARRAKPASAAPHIAA